MRWPTSLAVAGHRQGWSTTCSLKHVVARHSRATAHRLATAADRRLSCPGASACLGAGVIEWWCVRAVPVRGIRLRYRLVVLVWCGASQLLSCPCYQYQLGGGT